MPRPEPTRAAAASLIDQLLSGSMDRRTVALFATPLLRSSTTDAFLEKTLEKLTMLDAWQIGDDGRRTGYMYDLADLAALRPRLDRDD